MMSKLDSYHPCLNDHGELVWITKPSKSTRAESWLDPNATATVSVLDAIALPDELNGIQLSPWTDAPTTQSEWANVCGQAVKNEPAMIVPSGMHTSAGVVIVEPDSRIWIIHPTNAFGGYTASFAKGWIEKGLLLQAQAIKEGYEEAGLQVLLTGFFADIVRSTSVSRYYWARRVGGTPAAAGWESQAVSLVPKHELKDFLDQAVDKKMADQIIDSKYYTTMMCEQSGSNMESDMYLGDIKVVEKLVGQFINAIVTTPNITVTHITINRYAEIFLGMDEMYRAIPNWNDKEHLGRELARRLSFSYEQSSVDVFRSAFGVFARYALALIKESKIDQEGYREMMGLKRYMVSVLLGTARTLYPDSKAWH
jgi:ADP-ribose pyrophosphatase YjhB (NUDIX family)